MFGCLIQIVFLQSCYVSLTGLGVVATLTLHSFFLNWLDVQIMIDSNSSFNPIHNFIFLSSISACKLQNKHQILTSVDLFWLLQIKVIVTYKYKIVERNGSQN